MKKLLTVILILAIAMPAAVLAENAGRNIGTNSVFGKWTLYFDAREYNKTSAYPMDFDIQSIDLYIFENGSCYIVPFEIKNGTMTQTLPVSGIWIGNESEITMQFGDQVYKLTANPFSVTLHTMNADFKLSPVYSIDPMTYFAQ